MHVLGHLSVEEFLRDYWQKKPVLIRNAWPDFEPLLASDELAGLSLEGDIESRLVMENGPEGPWDIRKGPFTEADYQQLPEEKWTLLVQAVDHWIPEAADLLQHFRFIPNWRIDDLMISYAVDGGSVGPHYDQYDVFLLQAEGQREWRIGQMCSETSPILNGPKIRILEAFEETDRWVLNPGDMLYLPPQLAHWGISQGECQTYSIGFRAPSLNELAQATLDQVMQTSTEDQRYTDADFRGQKHPGAIEPEAVERLKHMLAQALEQPDLLGDVLGHLMTESKYPEHQPEARSDEEWPEWLEDIVQNGFVRRSEQARFAFRKRADDVAFYAAAQSWMIPHSLEALAIYLTDHNEYDANTLLDWIKNDTKARSLIQRLWCKQLLY
ncbi:MAG: cupin domain-containing protein [Oceanobacter sp.]